MGAKDSFSLQNSSVTLNRIICFKIFAIFNVGFTYQIRIWHYFLLIWRLENDTEKRLAAGNSNADTVDLKLAMTNYSSSVKQNQSQEQNCSW